MKKVLFSFITVCLLFLSSVLILPVSSSQIKSTSTGNTLYVGGSGTGDYTKIQDAIDNASDGDIVFVYSGTYYENIIVETANISLIGENKDTTIIDGRYIRTVLIFYEPNIEFSGFTIKNGGHYSGVGIRSKSNYNNIYDNIFKEINGSAISLDTDNNMIFNNMIISNGIGIYTEGSNNNISDNIIKDNEKGIKIDNYGKYNTIFKNIISNNQNGVTINSNANNLIGNNISDNINYGIYLSYGNHNVSKNIINSNGEKGLWLYASSSNNITYNHIKNHQIGIHVDYYNPDMLWIFTSSQNSINHNNFIGNEQEVKDEYYGTYWSREDGKYFTSGSNNIWDNNYWDSWIGLKYPLLDFIPYCIHGRLSFLLNIILKDKYPAEYDENPASEPYEIDAD